jgi:putative copper export protein
MRNAQIDVEDFRIILHVLSVSVWLGGQIVMGAIVPMIRKTNPEALSAISRGFARIAWPFFGLAVFTGIWNLTAIDSSATTIGWQALLGIKMLFVLLAGGAALIHQNTRKPPVAAAGAVIALGSSLIALGMGVVLSG